MSKKNLGFKMQNFKTKENDDQKVTSVYESGHRCTNSVGQSDSSCSCYAPNIINFFMVV